MARCEFFSSEKRIKLTPPEEIEANVGSSDSDEEISYILDLDMTGENKALHSPDSTGTSEEPSNTEEQWSTNVLSLKCLHDDDDPEEDSESSESDSVSEPENNDVQEVPEFSLQCLHEDDSVDDSGHVEDSENVESTNENTVEHAENVEDARESVKLAENKEVTKQKTLPSENQTKFVLVPELPSNSAVLHSSCIHLRSNWEGVHNFKIAISCPKVLKKSEGAVYCDLKHKLYVSKDFPFKVLVSAENVPVGSVIKVTAAFTSAEQAYSVVQRCPTHMQQDFVKGLSAFQHFVQCISDATLYEKNEETGKYNLSVPYQPPQGGENFTAYIFKLTCFSSCSGGINRRPFMLIFTLENNGVPLGRQTLEAKVCACPVRDIRVETEKEFGQRTHIQSVSPVSTPTSEQYTISTKDPELYEFIKEMKVLFESCAFVKKTLRKNGT